ncbi:hypothetical protein [Bradyrhizobium sp. HKCCYLS20291]|uniref:hypothetical protein n=1 Tax=Bradyrhizobium sp. HKCCYLS20291 TaxID=3420766 RepID=UPI003EBEDEA5
MEKFVRQGVGDVISAAGQLVPSLAQWSADAGAHRFDPATPVRPRLEGRSALRDHEGAGNAGRWPQPMARLQQKKQAAVTTGSAELRHSLRDGLNAYIVFSPVYGSLATVASRDHHPPPT